MQVRAHEQHRSRAATGFRWLYVVGVVGALAAIFAATTFGAARAGAPANTCAPTMDGSFVVGKAVTAGDGCWSNSPTSFTYKWWRCNQAGTSCAVIAGAS